MAISTGTALALASVPVVTSIIGGLFGSKSQKSANEANVQMQRETNEMNERLFHESQAFQEDMWNKTNAYNDPSHQTELLQKAGINPAAVYGNGSMSEASMPSSPTAPQIGAATVNPVDYSWIPNSIDMGVNAYFNNQILSNNVTKGKADAQIAKVQAEIDTQTMEYRAMKVINDSQASEFQKEQARVTLEVLRATKQDQIRQAQWQTDLMQKEYEKSINSIAESKLRQESQRIANEYAPKMNEASLKQFHASVASMYAAAREHDSAAVLNHARKAIAVLEKEGVRLDNQQKDSIMDALVDKAWSEADEAYWKSEEAAKLYKLGKRVGEFTPADRFDGDTYGSYKGRSRQSRHYRKLGVKQ